MVYLVIVSIKAIVFVPLAMTTLAVESIAALLTWDSTMIHGTSFDRLTAIVSDRDESDAKQWCKRRSGKPNKISECERELDRRDNLIE